MDTLDMDTRDMDAFDADTLDVTDFDLDIPDFKNDTISTDMSVREERRRDDAHDPIAAQPAEPGQRRTCCLAFQGVGGGAGTTSLAIATAHQLSRRARGQVCLVDLDFELGAIGHYLDIGSVPKMDDLRVDPGRIDETYMRALINHHDSGLAVLASPGVSGGNDLANAAAVIAMLDRLADMYPVLVLDVPRMRRPWTDAALLAADAVALVAELHIPALHLARQSLSRMENAGMDNAHMVINKYERRSFKASIRISDAERALGREVSATIGLDLQTPVEAINCGEPGGRLESDGRYGRDLALLAQALAPEFAEKRDRAAQGKRGLFRRG